MTYLRKPMKSFHVLLVLCVCCVIFVFNYGTDIVVTLNGDVFTEKNFGAVLSSKEVREVPDVHKNSNYNVTVSWTYTCLNNACIKKEASEFEVATAFEVCWLTCGSRGSVWPFPKQHALGPDTVKFFPENIRLVAVEAKSEVVQKLIKDAFAIKQYHFENVFATLHESEESARIFSSDSSSGISNKNEIQVSVSTNQTDQTFTLSTDEAYEINIEALEDRNTGAEQIVRLRVKITGSTFFGVRHGIETFSQLVAFDNVNGCLQIIRSYYAYDKPSFPYRGILVDSGRNFVPLHVIRRVVDGMALNKLNILHLHILDSNSFPFHSQRVPQMSAYGAITSDQIYYANDLKELVEYSRIRGVKVIPELDTPAHAGNGWQFGKKYGLGDLAFYINAYDSSWPNLCGQPPCGILNPVNKHVYEILGYQVTYHDAQALSNLIQINLRYQERLYADLFDIFDGDLFHMGGDEVNLASWQRPKELRKWLKSENKSSIDLWKLFQTEAFIRLRKSSVNVTAILWTSRLTTEKELNELLKPEDYIIQVWQAEDSTKELLDQGYSIILSTAGQLYLDWGCGTWLGKNHNWGYRTWQNLYDSNVNFRQYGDTVDGPRQVLGAEAPLWGEKVGPYDLEVKLWPRAAALAESFWSNPSRRNGEVYTRINYHNYRMRQQGIPTSQLQPESCLHFNGHCRNPGDIL